MAMIDNLTVLPRPRTAWQAMDAGFSLARAHFIPLLMLWLRFSLPIALLCFLLMATDVFLYSWILWWWFKPLYELPMLLYLSRVLFAEQPTVSQVNSAVRKQFWRLCKTYLSISRFSAARSMTAGTVFLEQLDRKNRRSRIDILSALPTRASVLMMACLHIEYFLAYLLIALLVVFMPSLVTDVDWYSLFIDADKQPKWFIMLTAVASYIAAAIVAPFFVAGGFLIYINRRMQLEAWDIEHRFRAIRRNRRINSGPAPTTHPLSLMCSLLMMAALLGYHQPTTAQSKTPELPTRQQAVEQINDILTNEEFGSTQTRRIPRYINADPAEDENAVTLSDGMISLFRQLAAFLQLFLWAAAISGIVLILYALRRFVPRLAGKQKLTRPPLADQQTRNRIR